MASYRPKRTRYVTPPASPPDAAEDARPSELAALARTLHARVAGGSAFDDPTTAAGGSAPISTRFLARYRHEFGTTAPAAEHHVAEYLRFMALKAALHIWEARFAAAVAAGAVSEAADAPAAPQGAEAADAAAAPRPPPPPPLEWPSLVPPLAVDAVWRTHTAHTRSYARLCATLLAADEDTEGGAAAAVGLPFLHRADEWPHGLASDRQAEARVRLGYDVARAMYAEAFGPPSLAAWPLPGVRFDAAEQWCVSSARERRDAAQLRTRAADFDSAYFDDYYYEEDEEDSRLQQYDFDGDVGDSYL